MRKNFHFNVILVGAVVGAILATTSCTSSRESIDACKEVMGMSGKLLDLLPLQFDQPQKWREEYAKLGVQMRNFASKLKNTDSQAYLITLSEDLIAISLPESGVEEAMRMAADTRNISIVCK